MDCVAWVQAISSVALAIFTAIFILQNKRIVEESSNALVTVRSILILDDNCSIRVVNHGPGHAVNVFIHATVRGYNSQKDEVNPGYTLTKLNGPEALPSGAEEQYKVRDQEYVFSGKVNLFMYYETQTGKRYRHEWEMKIDPPSSKWTFKGNWKKSVLSKNF